jgi:hypothetical protein
MAGIGLKETNGGFIGNILFTGKLSIWLIDIFYIFIYLFIYIYIENEHVQGVRVTPE